MQAQRWNTEVFDSLLLRRSLHYSPLIKTAGLPWSIQTIQPDYTLMQPDYTLTDYTLS